MFSYSFLPFFIPIRLLIPRNSHVVLLHLLPPLTFQDNDIDGTGIERVTTIRYLAKDSPQLSRFVAVDANNNTNEGDDDGDDDDEDLENAKAIAPISMKKSVSFEAVVEELNERHMADVLQGFVRTKQV